LFWGPYMGYPERILPMAWYYSNGGERRGPVSQSDFEKLARDGVILAGTLVWTEGMADWRPYSSVSGAAPADGAPPAADDTEVCAVSGKRYPRREMVQFEGKWISAEHRDEYFQRLREGVAQPGTFVYGGFWVRFCAKFVDGIILWVVGMLFQMVLALVVLGSANTFGKAMLRYTPHQRLVFQAFSIPLGILVAICYALFFISRWNATPGKMAMGLKLVRSDGSGLSYGRIVGRYFSEWISGLIFCIGYIMVAFDEQKRGLHDRICDTRVIKVK
jgi:uncharacterized RDD family membrane protein YckC